MNLSGMTSIKRSKEVVFDEPGGRVVLKIHPLPLDFAIRMETELPDGGISPGEREALLTVALILTCVDPVCMTLSTKPNTDRLAYYRAVLQEFSEFGLTINHIRTLVKEINTLSGLTPGQIEVARDGFLPTPTSGEPSVRRKGSALRSKGTPVSRRGNAPTG